MATRPTPPDSILLRSVVADPSLDGPCSEDGCSVTAGYITKTKTGSKLTSQLIWCEPHLPDWANKARDHYSRVRSEVAAETVSGWIDKAIEATDGKQA